MTTWRDRSSWGAASPNWSASILRTPVDNAWLHHTAGSVDSSVLAIQREHLARRNKNKKLNFQDIAYNALADQRGRSYVGRGLTAVHGNADGNNSFTTCAIGNFENVEPSEDLLNALAWQIVDVWLRGIVKHPRWSGGHRDLVKTACPGSKLHAKIPEINRRATEIARTVFDPDNKTTKENGMFRVLVWSAGHDGDLTTWVTDTITKRKVSNPTHADIIRFHGQAFYLAHDTPEGRYLNLKEGEWVPYNWTPEQIRSVPTA